MNKKKLKKIRRFGRLRFYGVTKRVANPIPGQPPMEIPFDPKLLVKVYKESSEEKRKVLDKEMDDYFEAIESGKIKPGESILLTPFKEGENAQETQIEVSHRS